MPGPAVAEATGRLRSVRNFASAVFAQALLSAASLVVSLILLRYGSDAHYGYYVLVLNAILLMTSLQSSFIGPAMVHRMTVADRVGRAALVGGLYREQRRIMPVIGIVVAACTCGMRLAGLLGNETTVLVLVAIVAALAALYREFFRMVLLAYRRPLAVLTADIFYVVVLVAGAAAATFTPDPAIATVAALSLAALGGGFILARALWTHEAWDITGARGILRDIAGVGAWTTSGSAIHWSFSQGYNYLIAATLDVTAVAESASTRLLMMPVNLLSGGVSSLMLPTASSWLVKHGARDTFRRLSITALAITTAAAAYLVVAWWMRDFIFTTLLHKHFANRDTLMLLWSATAVLMIFRDQILYMLLVRGRYRSLTMLTLASAIVSLVISYLAMRRIGVIGAPVGVLSGEAVNVVGLLVMSVAEVRRSASE